MATRAHDDVDAVWYVGSTEGAAIAAPSIAAGIRRPCQ
jgi:hypothetical protein